MFRFFRTLGLSVAFAICIVQASPAQPAPEPDASEPWRELRSSYDVTIAGLTVGQLNLDGILNDRAYRLIGTGKVSGLAALLSSGEGQSRSNGMFSGESTYPVRFAHDETAGGESLRIRMDMRDGAVRNLSINPPVDRPEERVALTEAHKRGVLDPMSALLVRMPGEGPLVAEAACNRTIPVFDGRHRFDVQLRWVGTQEPTLPDGTKRLLADCRARYVPVAGHRETSKKTRNAGAQEIEVWLVPVAGTRTLIPYRLALQTPFGQLLVTSRRFDVKATSRQALAD